MLRLDKRGNDKKAAANIMFHQELTMSTRSRTLPFDSVQIIAFFFRPRSPALLSGHPVGTRHRRSV